jgi:hypothetical protein
MRYKRQSRQWQSRQFRILLLKLRNPHPKQRCLRLKVNLSPSFKAQNRLNLRRRPLRHLLLRLNHPVRSFSRKAFRQGNRPPLRQRRKGLWDNRRKARDRRSHPHLNLQRISAEGLLLPEVKGEGV